MKFATYLQEKESESRFGFKKENYIIDITRAAQWASEVKDDPKFLEIPATLKEALGDWKTHFTKLKELETLRLSISISQWSIHCSLGRRSAIAFSHTKSSILSGFLCL